jgi:hypothetical protein
MPAANHATQPDEHRFHGITPFHFSFTLRWRNWQFTEKGLFRWWGFVAVKPNSKGVRAVRYGWRKLFPTPDH